NGVKLIFYPVAMSQEVTWATYSSPNERIFAPSQLISPSSGGRSPHRIRSKLVLPLPFGPVIWTNVPGDTDRSSPLKSLRSPRTQPSLLTSNICACPPVEHCNYCRLPITNSLVLGFWLYRAAHSQPFLPAALQNSHAREATGLKNLRR